MTSRVILHVDMDAFFAAIEQHDHPELQGKPVVVGADPRKGQGRGVVSTCSYQARTYGIHSAMPIAQAYKRCPHAIFVPPRGRRYSEVSRQVMDILYDFSPDVQPLSIDEAFMDISSTWKFHGSVRSTAQDLKDRIFQETGLTASVGVAPNKFIAKIASDLQKPDGLVIVEPEEVSSFLAPLDIKRMWGVGPKTLPRLHEMGIRTLGDLAARPLEELERRLGKAGNHFWRLSRGQDERPVHGGDPAKSTSKETTFGTDCFDKETIRCTLLFLCDEVARELRRHHYQGRTITLKIRFADFTTFTRSLTLSYFTQHSDDIWPCIWNLYKEFDRDEKAVRLLGVSVSNFSESALQLDLFSSGSQKKSVESLMDNVRDKFGKDAITRASLISRKKSRRE
ncbi:DNA polymerase IV [candidate division KSB1 bacterium]|nr:DNA polymerase IV [candidate division KSB1 bacterium]